MSSKIYFLHANGIPAKTYEVLFEALDANEVFYRNCIGLNSTKGQKLKSWKPFRDEVIADLEGKDENGIIAIGHSMGGAVAMLAEAHKPGLFSKIILLDPVILRPIKCLMAQLSNYFGLSEFAPIVRKAKKRNNQFVSREAARAYWQRRSFFKRFEEESFNNYLKHGLIQNKDGFELKIPKDHEYQVFKTAGNRIHKLQLNPSIHLILAESGSAMDTKDVDWFKNNIGQVEIQKSEGTHMFPLENPVATAKLIKGFL